MNKHEDIAKYLLNNGLNNLERLNKSLDPNSISIMHLGVEKWVEFTHSFAQKANYFMNDEVSPSGDWQAFFEWAKQNKTKIEEYNAGEANAHIALFIAFLKLLNFSKESLNKLTQRHLDFYYRDVLQLKNKPFKSDDVFTTFQLNKNIDAFLIPKDTALNGQKCEDGNIRNYKTYKDVVINKAEIVVFKNLYTDDTGVYSHSAEDVKELNSIFPFGNTLNERGEYGFSISSPELKLKEGDRTITIVIKFFENVAASITAPDLLASLQLSYTSAKGWTKDVIKTVIINANKIKIVLSLGSEDEALVAPSFDIHKREHQYPLIRFLYAGETGRKLFLNWSDFSLSSISIITEAIYSENLIVKTDQGIIDPKNEFYPFGSIPKKGSKFSVHADEWIDKKIIKSTLVLNWKGLPNNLENHYKGYHKECYLDSTKITKCIPDELLVQGTAGKNRFIVGNDFEENSVFDTIIDSDSIEKVSSKSMFEGFNFGAEKYTFSKWEECPMLLTLRNDFCHDVFPTLLANAILPPPSDYIPKPPFAPLADKISVKIMASALYSLSDNGVTLFHEYPFGYSEVGEFDEEFLPDLKYNQGECILGIDNFEPHQLINILFQLEEGTENPEKNSNNSKTLGWQYLSANTWVDLSNDYIVESDIDHFLKSGLMTIKIPTFDSNNTMLPSGKFWIRAFIKNHFETTSRIVGVHAQTILSRFENNNNALTHLKDGLAPNTISKLINRQAQVKKIEQLYPSFNGRLEEDDPRFYRRISERLRHKDRCVSAWDYNHLILEEFPFIHKVKTINHSVKSKYAEPGEVLILVIPSMINQKVFNVLKPMISQAKVNEIEKCVNAKNSLHVDAKVISPTYIPVKIKAKVKYYDGYDSYYYNKQLQADITAMFAPWAFDNTVDIPLGGGIYYTQVVHYIEKLEYVDYIKDLKILVTGSEVRTYLPNDPIVVMTSVPKEEHEFEIIEKSICTP